MNRHGLALSQPGFMRSSGIVTHPHDNEQRPTLGWHVEIAAARAESTCTAMLASALPGAHRQPIPANPTSPQPCASSSRAHLVCSLQFHDVISSLLDIVSGLHTPSLMLLWFHPHHEDHFLDTQPSPGDRSKPPNMFERLDDTKETQTGLSYNSTKATLLAALEDANGKGIGPADLHGYALESLFAAIIEEEKEVLTS